MRNAVRIAALAALFSTGCIAGPTMGHCRDFERRAEARGWCRAWTDSVPIVQVIFGLYDRPTRWSLPSSGSSPQAQASVPQD